MFTPSSMPSTDQYIRANLEPKFLPSVTFNVEVEESFCQKNPGAYLTLKLCEPGKFESYISQNLEPLKRSYFFEYEGIKNTVTQLTVSVANKILFTTTIDLNTKQAYDLKIEAEINDPIFNPTFRSDPFLYRAQQLRRTQSAGVTGALQIDSRVFRSNSHGFLGSQTEKDPSKMTRFWI